MRGIVLRAGYWAFGCLQRNQHTHASSARQQRPCGGLFGRVSDWCSRSHPVPLCGLSDLEAEDRNVNRHRVGDARNSGARRGANLQNSRRGNDHVANFDDRHAGKDHRITKIGSRSTRARLKVSRGTQYGLELDITETTLPSSYSAEPSSTIPGAPPASLLSPPIANAGTATNSQDSGEPQQLHLHAGYQCRKSGRMRWILRLARSEICPALSDVHRTQ